MMIDGAILFAVDRVETVTGLEFFPSHKVLDSTGRTAVTWERYVYQNIAIPVITKFKRNTIVNLVYG